MTDFEQNMNFGVVRLDRGPNHFMCCICFDWVLYTEAYESETGERWDMCPKCGSRETCHEKQRYVK